MNCMQDLNLLHEQIFIALCVHESATCAIVLCLLCPALSNSFVVLFFKFLTKHVKLMFYKKGENVKYYWVDKTALMSTSERCIKGNGRLFVKGSTASMCNLL